MVQTPLNSESSIDLGFRSFLNEGLSKEFNSEIRSRAKKVETRETTRRISNKPLSSADKLKQLHEIFSSISGPIKFTSNVANPFGIEMYYAKSKDQDRDLHLLYTIAPEGQELSDKSAQQLANHFIQANPPLNSIKMIELKKIEPKPKLKSTRTFPVEIIMGKLFKRLKPTFKNLIKTKFSNKFTYEIDKKNISPKLKRKKGSRNHAQQIIVHNSSDPNFNLVEESQAHGDDDSIHIRITPPRAQEGFFSTPKFNSMKSSRNSKIKKEQIEISLEDEKNSKAKIEIIGKKAILQKLIDTNAIREEMERDLSHKSGKAGEQITKQLFRVLGAYVMDKTRGAHPFDLQIEQGSISDNLWQILSPNNHKLALEVKSSKYVSPSISYVTINQLSYFTDTIKGRNSEEIEPIIVKVNLGDDFSLTEVATIFKDYPPTITQKENSIVIKPDLERSKDKKSPYKKIVLINFNKLKEKAQIEVSEVNLRSKSGTNIKNDLLNRLNFWIQSNEGLDGTDSKNLQETFKKIEDDLDLSIATVSEIDKLIKDSKLNLNERNLMFKLRQHILQNHLSQNFEANAVSSLTSTYNSSKDNNLIIDYIPVRDQNINLLENKIWSIRTMKGMSYGDQQKELERLERSAQDLIKDHILKHFLRRNNSPWKIKKLQNNHITLTNQISGKTKYVEILPFSYTLKTMKYPADKIMDTSVKVDKSQKPISRELETSTKLVAFYNKYDQGIYLTEAKIPEQFKQDLIDLIEDPTKHKKATFQRGDFSLQARNIRIHRRRENDELTFNSETNQEIKDLITRYKLNTLVQDIALEEFYNTPKKDIPDDELRYFQELLTKQAKSMAIKHFYNIDSDIVREEKIKNLFERFKQEENLSDKEAQKKAINAYYNSYDEVI